MKIYRYEHEDGGGPFVKPNGWLRVGPKLQIKPLFNSKEKYGCLSLEQLQSYFKGQEYVCKDCSIKIYEVPENNILHRGRNEVIFIPNN